MKGVQDIVTLCSTPLYNSGDSIMKTKMVVCDNCGESFEKLEKYINQSLKRGMKQFCSRKCFNISNKTSLLQWSLSEENKKHISKVVGGHKKDEFSDFRYFLRNCKRRDKSSDLDLLFLKELWECQGGFCAITNIPLILSQNGNPNTQASLDRIDSRIGYIKGNVRYTSLSINWLKNNYTDDHLFEFFGIVKEMVVNKI